MEPLTFGFLLFLIVGGFSFLFIIEQKKNKEWKEKSRH
jgi:preprotein translocase subunit YajC